MKEEMMNNDLEILLHKKLTGQATEAELVALAMLQESDDVMAESKAVRDIWEGALAYTPKVVFEANSAFAKFMQNVESETTLASTTQPVREVEARIVKMPLRRMLSIAAAFVGLLAVGALVLRYNNQSIETRSQTLAHTFNDGSVMHMAPHSQVRVLGDRSIVLKGNAFFDIKHNPEKPFEINMPDQTKVTVLGTSFTIDQTDKGIYVSLLEGSVRMSKGQESITIVPGQQAIWKGNTLMVADVASSNAYSLQTGSLNFQDAELLDVIHDFERHYNTELILVSSDKVQVMDGCTLTAHNISAKDPLTAAKGIAAVFGGEAYLIEDQIFIKNFSCK